MSFSSDVKEELIKHFTKSKKCQKAELAALILFNSRGLIKDKETGKYIYIDHRAPSDGDNNSFTELRKTFNIDEDPDLSKSLREIVRKPDEKRAFLRGAFIATGNINSPQKEYHFEILAPALPAAELIIEFLAEYNITAKVAERRGKYQVYVKEAEEISDILNIIEAHVSMMEFENVRIEREIRGSVNRRMNCDTANINKTINASMKQIEDIELIRDTVGFDSLEEGLRDICYARLSNPDATLSALGEFLNPPIGKSGVNHRLRKLSTMAEKIRARKKEIGAL